MKEISIKVGKNHTIDQLQVNLIEAGYEKVTPGDISFGQFYISGGTIRIQPVDSSSVITVDYFGNEIETITAGAGSTKIRKEEIKLSYNVLTLSDGSKIKPGDYIVHEDHGIGLFSRLEIKKVQGQEIEYIYLNYLNNDVLYLPINLKDKLSTYIGVGKRHPRLSKLGSQTWSKTYKKTYENIQIMAKELLLVYAQRKLVTKRPWQINTEWDEIVKTNFEFDETPDQSKSIADVFKDFQKNLPMDRLICGDVGLGKTEVALRAITQTIANGYQAVVLVPTTILAEQHFTTFSKRLRDLPITVAKLSRLVDQKQQNETIKKVSEGTVDLLIGTHRVLKNDLNFKNLGLVVVDEEQKFGVKDKEKLKSIKQNVSVLTITATPIPRTLFMALSGLRDVSQINSIPLGRLSVETSVIKYDRVDILKKIKAELSRGGQVYYLHNEVRTIIPVKKWLEGALLRVNIAVGHGQMKEDNLAKVMGEFAAAKIDILVCSTIIENGLDLANVNTLVVDDAEAFGLSQLHQIRGRIGRSNRQAYAVFTYKEKKLTNNALKRFKSLVNYSEIGSGYNIALSDLEIRGGGNILGKEQHGNMEAIGLVLYTKLLKLAVDKLRASGPTVIE